MIKNNINNINKNEKIYIFKIKNIVKRNLEK